MPKTPISGTLHNSLLATRTLAVALKHLHHRPLRLRLVDLIAAAYNQPTSHAGWQQQGGGQCGCPASCQEASGRQSSPAGPAAIQTSSSQAARCSQTSPCSRTDHERCTACHGCCRGAESPGSFGAGAGGAAAFCRSGGPFHCRHGCRCRWVLCSADPAALVGLQAGYLVPAREMHMQWFGRRTAVMLAVSASSASAHGGCHAGREQTPTTAHAHAHHMYRGAAAAVDTAGMKAGACVGLTLVPAHNFRVLRQQQRCRASHTPTLQALCRPASCAAWPCVSPQRRSCSQATPRTPR